MNDNKYMAIKKKASLKSTFFRWEWMLVLLLILVNILNSQMSEYYWDINGIFDAFKVFLDKGFLVLAMAFVLLIGEIDISVASIIALSSCIMGIAYNNGVPMPVAMLVAVVTGAICGLINGLLVAHFRELASMIITLATMSLYRGIAWMLLEANSAGGYPDWYSWLSEGTLFKIGELSVPFVLVVFIVCAVIFGLILHKTTFGKKLYSIGHNDEASRYTGIKVKNIRIIVYTLTGLMAGISSLFLTSRLFTSRANIAMGYELEVIAVVVLGGVKSDGGTGTILGVSLSLFLIGLIRYGLGISGVRTEVILVVIGLLLILSILIPNILSNINRNKKLSK